MQVDGNFRLFVRILLCMCTHSTIYVSSYVAGRAICKPTATFALIAGLILLHLCPHTTTYVSASFYVCVQVVQYGSQRQLSRRLDALIQISDPSAPGEWGASSSTLLRRYYGAIKALLIYHIKTCISTMTLHPTACSAYLRTYEKMLLTRQ